MAIVGIAALAETTLQTCMQDSAAAVGGVNNNFVQGVGAGGFVQGVSSFSNLNAHNFGRFHYNDRHYYSDHYGHDYGHGHRHRRRNRFNFWFGSGGFFGSWSSHRYHFGFGYHYSPYYYRSAHYYPYYRRYSYYPYHYYNTVAYYPAYRAVYYSDYAVGDYADTTDPYVEYVDSAAPVTVVTARALPAGFETPFATGLPEGMSTAEALARGDEWLRVGKYDLASEAFRLAWLGAPDDYYAPFQLALGLVGMSRYELGGRALQAGLDRNSSWIHRRESVVDHFSGPHEFGLVMKDLERFLVRYPTNSESRFLLGYLQLFSGEEYAANQTFRELERGGFASSHLAGFVAESEARLLETKDG